MASVINCIWNSNISLPYPVTANKAWNNETTQKQTKTCSKQVNKSLQKYLETKLQKLLDRVRWEGHLHQAANLPWAFVALTFDLCIQDVMT